MFAFPFFGNNQNNNNNNNAQQQQPTVAQRRRQPAITRSETVATVLRQGQRVYVYKTLCKQEKEAQDDAHDNSVLRLQDLSYMECQNLWRSNSHHPVSNQDLSDVLTAFAASLHDGTRSKICRLEMSSQNQVLLYQNNRTAFLHLMRGLPSLAYLTLGFLDVDILASIEASGCAATLRHLEINCLHVTVPAEQARMVEILSSFQSLTSLVWKTDSSLNRLVADQVQIIGQVVQNLPQLQCLYLQGSSSTLDLAPFEALQCLQHCSRLEELVLQDWNLSTAVSLVLADAIASHQSLQRLKMRRCQLLQAGWDAILTALQSNQALIEFSFGETRILRSDAAGSVPTRLVWERLAFLLQDYNHTLQHMENGGNNGSTHRIWRLLELNQSNFRQRLPDAKLGPLILGMASHSPSFMFPILRNNVEELLVRRNHHHGIATAEDETGTTGDDGAAAEGDSDGAASD